MFPRALYEPIGLRNQRGEHDGPPRSIGGHLSSIRSDKLELQPSCGEAGDRCFPAHCTSLLAYGTREGSTTDLLAALEDICPQSDRTSSSSSRVVVKLGIDVSPRTVRAYWPTEPERGARRTSSQHWRTFVLNQIGQARVPAELW